MIQRAHIGDFELCSVQLWPVQQLPAAEVLADVDARCLARAQERLPLATGSEPQTVALALNVFVVRGPGLTVLVDTGEAVRRGGDVLLWGLAALGLAPQEVDLVFLTHRDDDHTGGAVDLQGQPRFPRARYLLSRAEHDAFQAEPQRAAAFRSVVAPLQAQGQLELFDGETGLAPGLTAVPTPGHRSGACSLRLHSEGQGALLLADTLHCAVQTLHPEWSSVWDADHAQAASTRAWVVEQAEQQGLLLAVPHIPLGGLGHVRREAGERRWVPLA